MEREWELQGSSWHRGGVVRNEGISLLRVVCLQTDPAGVQLRQPGPCCGLGKLLCLRPAELPLSGAWHWCQRWAEGGCWHCTFVTEFCFDSGSTDSFPARIAGQRFHLQLLCLSAGVQRVLMLGRTLGVLIARGQLWGCSPCGSCARAGSVCRVCGDCGDHSLGCWAGIRGSLGLWLVLGIRDQRDP